MKKFTLVFLSLFLVGVVSAQLLPNQKSVRLAREGKIQPTMNVAKSTNATVPYLETFDTGMPADYQVFDLDGNVVYTPYQSFITAAWSVVTLTGFTTPAATSTSWYNTPGTSNDWMITTGIDIPASGTFQIKWKAKASDTSPYNDSYEVYVTNTIAGSTPVVSDFSAPAVYSNPGENNSWTNRSYVLPGSFNGTTIYIAFRNNANDCNLLSIDDVEVNAYTAFVNDIEVLGTYVDFDGMSYYEVTPLSQVGTVDLGAEVVNNGSAAQTNVTLHVDDALNGISGTEVLASLASGAQTDLIYTATLDNVNAKSYGFKMNVTQTETDEVPANNEGDSIYFDTDPSWYLRTSDVNIYLSSYSFAAPIVASTGMEYGCNYHFINNDRVDSIMFIIYGAVGTGTVTTKLYSVDLGTGDRTVVAQSDPYTPAGTPWEYVQLALTTPYNVTAPAVLTATVQLNINTSANDTISILADGTFLGDAATAGIGYLNNAGTWGWYTYGAVPFVGLIVDFASGINNNNIVSKDLFIYPNPVSNTLYIVNQKAVSVEFYNLTGEIVAKYNNKNTIDVSGFAQGTYLVKVITDKKVITEKINIIR